MLRPLARQRNIRLEVEADLDIPLVYADPDRILGVLVNLIDNAIKFTEPGGAVTVKISSLETDSEFAYVSVVDSGRGIAVEALPLIFERLYQDPDSVDGNRSGLGLGLYIAKELVTLHGGRIWVASVPGDGSTFSFSLPLYSLPRLLAPVITHDNQLRDSIVLVRVDLVPRSPLARGNWKEVCHESLELLRRCVYLDKDLVLSPMSGSGSEETFYVVASTDMERVQIMTARVLEQLGALPLLKSSGTVRVTAAPVTIESNAATPLDQQVEALAKNITAMITFDLGDKHMTNRKRGQPNVN
jgi:hypothetical protein